MVVWLIQFNSSKVKLFQGKVFVFDIIKLEVIKSEIMPPGNLRPFIIFFRELIDIFPEIEPTFQFRKSQILISSFFLRGAAQSHIINLISILRFYHSSLKKLKGRKTRTEKSF